MGFAIRPAKAEPVGFSLKDGEFAIEGIGRVPKTHHLQLISDHAALQAGIDVCCGEVGSVDLFVATGPASVGRLVVVGPSEEIQIPDLGRTGHKQLDGTGETKAGFTLPQGAEERGVHLVVGDLGAIGAVEVLDPAASLEQPLDDRLNRCIGQESLCLSVSASLEIEHGDTVVATQHVHRLEVVVDDLTDPTEQAGVLTGVDGVDHQAGEEEVIDGVTLVRELLVEAGAVLGMDLRKQD